MRIASSRLIAALTVAFALVFGFSSAVVAQNRTKNGKPVKTKPLKKKKLKKGKKGGKVSTKISLADKLCGPNQQIGANTYESYERCGGSSCPPSPMQICRRVKSTCKNSKGEGTYNAYSAPECRNKPAPSTSNPAQTQGLY